MPSAPVTGSTLYAPDVSSAARSSGSSPERPASVLLVTSWETPCGIAAHSESLIQAIPWRRCGYELVPDSASLNPDQMLVDRPFKILHLNHHDALHARWNSSHFKIVREEGMKIVVTYHDTRAQVAEANPKLAEFIETADAVVVHEPIDQPYVTDPREVKWKLPLYLRQGIPAPTQQIADYWLAPYQGGIGWREPTGYLHSTRWKAFPTQPVLGMVGFNFPWKNFDRMAELTHELGWAIVILSNNATIQDENRWRAMNPHALIIRRYLPEDEALGYLAACDATAFPYECHNTGTSGAIRLGIAARKPVLAFRHCRQFRDLLDEKGIYWCDTWSDLGHALQVDLGAGSSTPWQAPRVADLAHRDRWAVVGDKYRQVYDKLLGRDGQAGGAQ